MNSVVYRFSRYLLAVLLLGNASAGDTVALTLDSVESAPEITIKGRRYTVVWGGEEVSFGSEARYVKAYVGRSNLLAFSSEQLESKHYVCIVDLEKRLFFEACLNDFLESAMLIEVNMTAHSALSSRVFQYWNIGEWLSGDNSVLLRCRLNPNNPIKGVLRFERENFRLTYFSPTVPRKEIEVEITQSNLKR